MSYRCCINPGHAPGGIPDPGAVNDSYNAREFEIAYNIGKKLEQYLHAVGISTVFVQSDSLGEITYTANVNQCNLFISVHCNSFGQKSAQGTETLVYANGGQSELLANCIQAQIVENLDTFDRGVRERPELYVLKHTNMPAVLVETAFISNDVDVDKLIHRQDEFAAAIARGVTDFLSL